MALEPAKLSDFTMAGALGSGTTARVYEAVHTATGRPVAIKVMEHSGSAGSPGEMRERFAREALLLSGVDSRHVSKILGFGFDKGQPFLVLERLHGETLDAKLRRDGPVPASLAVRWIEQLIIGIRDCHDAKIIHRDIKPSNIFLHLNGFEESVKLIDFGVARLREIAGDTGLTSTNHLIGSMGYMAPEQFKSAKSVGYPADLYAVGVVIFRTLTGRLPFVSRSIETIIKMKSEQSAPSVSSMGGPHNGMLDWFVQKALLREPEGRFQSAREMLEQWWNVASSLDEGKTDVMGGLRGVPQGTMAHVPMPQGAPVQRDVSLASASPHARPPTQPPQVPSHARPNRGTTPPPRMLHADPPTQAASTLSGPYPDGPPESGGDERTIRRPAIPRAPVPLPSTHAPGVRRTPSVQPFDRTVREQDAPPLTMQSAAFGPETQAVNYDQAPSLVDATDDEVAPTPIAALAEDPFDAPTRNDPNLRRLVERELELQKARKRGK